MPDEVITVENLSKSYLIGHNKEQEAYYAMRDIIVRNTKNFMRKAHDMLKGQPIIQGDEITEFWALRDVSFKVAQGERVGIIGRNGAGKSTLLKLLSRITEPTSGRIKIIGRLASLLEVGTGFHPELTGRENIYLNGSILGMTRKEINLKFDQIVEFSEIESFLDTPVKRYSSGMYMRLAFSIAAHLEPEILIVDEVLAVGDTQFQKKCLGKMEEVSKEGRTVLFVSHNIAAIQHICTRVIVLKKGMMEINALPSEAISFYLESSKEIYGNKESVAKSADGSVELLAIELFDKNGCAIGSAICGQFVCIRLKVNIHSKIKAIISIGIDNAGSSRVSLLANVLKDEAMVLEQGISYVDCEIPVLTLFPGRYSLSPKITTADGVKIWAPNSVSLVVDKGDFFGSGVMFDDVWMGNVLIMQNWSRQKYYESN